jgi:hypothetical protein
MLISGTLQVNRAGTILNSICIRKNIVVTSITGLSGTVTVTTTNPHYIDAGYTVQILGCATAAHNGLKTVLTTPTPTTFTYAAVGNATSLVGTCGLMISRMTCRTSASNSPASFAINAYLDDITENDYFEIYVTTTNNGDVVKMVDLNWVFKT